jgi:tRNA threonylcarbamoyladenosine biosynthesis protein TsaE
MIKLNSADEMLKFGMEVSRSIHAPLSIYLVGALGSGKTVFARGLLAGLDVQDTITSPSYLVAKEHIDARIRAVHIDLFRIDSYDKFRSLGLEEYFDGTWVVICEWADRINELGFSNVIVLQFRTTGHEERSIEIDRVNVVGQSLLLEAILKFDYD